MGRSSQFFFFFFFFFFIVATLSSNPCGIGEKGVVEIGLNSCFTVCIMRSCEALCQTLCLEGNLESESPYEGGMDCDFGVGEILTVDNLIEWGMVAVNRFCMCKSSIPKIGSVLHCPVAMELWDFVFVVSGIKWFMPKMMNLLLYW